MPDYTDCGPFETGYRCVVKIRDGSGVLILREFGIAPTKRGAQMAAADKALRQVMS
jgi:hypothetical protein